MSVNDQDRASDLLIQEVDEDLRREQYEKLWKQYGNWIIAAALAVVLIVAGYQGYQGWDKNQRNKEALAFEAARSLAATGKTQEASDAFAKLAADGHAGVAVESQMIRAQLLQQSGDNAGAVAAYEALAKSSAPSVYRDLAVVKAALLTIDNGDASPYEPRLAQIANASNPWHSLATETLAMQAIKKGDLAKATDFYKKLSDDATTPEGMRGRATEMLAALAQAKS